MLSAVPNVFNNLRYKKNRKLFINYNRVSNNNPFISNYIFNN